MNTTDTKSVPKVKYPVFRNRMITLTTDQKDVADNKNECKDANADVVAVLVQVEGGVGNEPAYQTHDRG